MEPTPTAVTYDGKYRFINVKNGTSASYIINNLCKSESFVAYARNKQGQE